MKTQSAPLTFTLNRYGNNRRVLAKACKSFPNGFPVQYANITAAEKALAKMADPQSWEVCGTRPFYIALKA